MKIPTLTITAAVYNNPINKPIDVFIFSSIVGSFVGNFVGQSIGQKNISLVSVHLDRADSLSSS